MRLFISSLAIFGFFVSAEIATSAANADTWMAGDLHAHSNLSDGKNSVADVVGYAEKIGLDFFALTDHDWHMQGRMRHWYSPDYTSQNLVLLYATEWTTARGHANLFSAEPFPYLAPWIANLSQSFSWLRTSVSKIPNTVFISANHPHSIKFGWRYPRINLASVEVWNGPFEWFAGNRKTVDNFWISELLSGHRVVAVGGSDTHNIFGSHSLGNPTTWVNAERRTAEGVLTALQSGKVSLSCDRAAPRLELFVDSNLDGLPDAGIGETAPSSGSVKVVVNVAPNAAAFAGTGEVRVYRNGALFKTIPTAPQFLGQHIVEDFSIPPLNFGFYYAELHWTDNTPNPYCPPKNGSLIALTNPVYVENK